MVDLHTLFQFFKKHVTKYDVLLTLVLILLYAATRLIRLDQFPIFTDEGIYIRWAKVAQIDPNWRFISLTDGKQPLHTWGMIPFLKLFPNNLLLGGRLFSVLSGAVAMIGIAATATYVFGKKQAGYIAALLYIATPMFLFYDRLALADSAVNAGAIWMLLGSVVLVRTLRLDVALLMGIGAGVALLAKSSSQMFLGLSFLAPILRFDKKRTKPFFGESLTYWVLLTIAATIALAIYNVQRLSPYLYMVAEKNKTFVLTFAEFAKAPFALFVSNTPYIPWYISAEMSHVLALIGVVGIVTLIRRDWRTGLYLASWIILPYLAITSFAKLIFPRYIIYLASFLTLGAAYWFVSTKKRVWVMVAITASIISISYFDYSIIFQPSRIPLPAVDRGQYIESFNAGWGVKDIIQYARDERDRTGRPVKLLAEGNFGVIGDMLESSINRNDHDITVSGYWPLGEKELREEQKHLDAQRILVVFSHREQLSDIPTTWPVRFLKEYKKPGGKNPFFLFELTAK